MSGFTTPSIEGYNWHKSVVPSDRKERSANMETTLPTDVIAGLPEQIIRNAAAIFKDDFDHQREYHRHKYYKKYGSFTGYHPLQPSDYFHIAVYTVATPAVGHFAEQFIGFRAILFRFESTHPGHRIKHLAKSEKKHRASAKTALEGLLHVTAGIMWSKYNDTLLEIEREEGGFFSASSQAASRASSPESVRQGQLTPMGSLRTPMGSLRMQQSGSGGGVEYFSPFHPPRIGE